ncbi:MAG: DUF2436 domain-containing protein [Clostridia bacterium]|nr:DUF2436 domain-containing protein [Clostridia bacterium]
MTKKIISILVAAMMALCLIPAVGLAEARVETRPGSENEVTVVLNVPEDIWGDGTGYQMLLDADATAYGTIIPEPGVAGKYTGNNYDEFEYMIPENADCSASASNIVILGSMQINIPAGTYDYMITNPDNAGSIWIASAYGNVSGREDDFVFEANKTYTFTLSRYETYDRVDLEVTDGVADPSVITTVAVTNFVEPVWGEAPAYDVTVPSSANYSITYADWNWEADLDGEQLVDGDIFDNEEYGYFMFFIIEANDGYTFSEDVLITVNGHADYVGPNYIDATEIIVATVDFFVSEPIDLDDALNVEGGTIHFESEGEYPWVGVEDEDGTLYAMSGNAGIGSSDSVLTAVVTVEEGATVTFDFQAWGEGTGTYWDYCEFAVDGERRGYWGAYQNEEWETFTSAPLTAGEHILTWTYHKDGTINKPGDCFMIDNVSVPVTEPTDPEPTEVLGDVDMDGDVDTADALLALRYSMGLIELTEQQLAQAEVDGDGEVTIVDSLLIIRKAMELIESFPAEN